MFTENSQQSCSNCNKEFPIDKIDLHQAYCCRNIRRCQQCDAMVDIKDMDEHNVNIINFILENYIRKSHVLYVHNNFNQVN